MFNPAFYIEIKQIRIKLSTILNIKSLCILRLSAIGDVCHAVAMVERIQRMTPQIKITWIIGKVEHQLVGDIPGVNFIVFDKRKGWDAFKTIRNELKGIRFDALFTMQVALRANLASLMVRAKIRVGFDWDRSKELHYLFTNKRIERQKFPHVLQGFMAFADAIGVPKVEHYQWHIPIPKDAEDWANEQSKQLGKYVVLAPSASKQERNWTAKGYAQTANYLTEKGYKVVLSGGPGELDRQLGEQICLFTDNIVMNYTGKTSLKQMLALLKNATLVIAPDTGPAHMATTVATPVIGLYAHSNPLRTGPFNNLQNVVSVYDTVIAKQKGVVWQDLPWGVRAKGGHLMEQIQFNQVKLRIDQLLN